MKQLKITKLFHWLYALLMLAPCFAVLFTCLYVAFNNNAFESYSYVSEPYQKITYTYETNVVDNTDNTTTRNSLVEGNIYMLTIDRQNVYYEIFYNNENLLILDWNINGAVTTNFNRHNSIPFYTRLMAMNFETFQIYNADRSVVYLACSPYGSSIYRVFLYFIYNSHLNINNSVYTISECPIEHIPYTTETIVENDTLDNVFYYSLDKVASSDIFGWARYSFIAQPFSYITGLFGMSADNPLNIYFSYWASISIIWLVFDIVLYVPLLAHKWLDEGGI